MQKETRSFVLGVLVGFLAGKATTNNRFYDRIVSQIDALSTPTQISAVTQDCSEVVKEYGNENADEPAWTVLPPKFRPIRASHQAGGVVIFLHVPKTGGESMRLSLEQPHKAWLDYSWGEISEPIAAVDIAVRYRNTTIERNRVLLAEMHLGMPTMVKFQHKIQEWRSLAAENGIPFFVYTMVRKSVPFAVSWYEYRCIWFQQECGKWSAAENEESLRATLLHDPQMGFFLNKWRRPDEAQPRQEIPSRRDLTATWEAILSSVDWVGRTEAYSDTVQVLQVVMGRQNLKANWIRSNKNQGTLNAKNLTATTKNVILGLSLLDQALYHRVEETYRLDDPFGRK